MILLLNVKEIRNLPETDGLAIISDENIITDGSTPDVETLGRIAEWALGNTDERIYVSRSFLKDHGKELELTDNAAGIAIYFIERDKNEMLIWFRKEFDEHINWAGNPEKKIELFFSEWRGKTYDITKNFIPDFHRKYQRVF